MNVEFKPAKLLVGTGTAVARETVYGVFSVNGRTGDVVLDKEDVGLGNVDNTSDAEKKAAYTGEIADGDAGFVTGGEAYEALAGKADADDVPTPSDVAPEMDGTPDAGIKTQYSRADHRHPHDSAKLSLTGGTMSGAIAMGGSKITGIANGTAATDAAAFGQIPTPSEVAPEMDGTPDAGIKTQYSRADHRHPHDSAKLSLTGGTMSGVIAMGGSKITGLADGTAASDAAAFGQIPTPSSTTPAMDGTASAGSENAWAHGDHVHPTDTSRMAASLKGAASGVAELDASGKVPTAQMPYSLTHETWTFTLSDGTTATKEVVLWS